MIPRMRGYTLVEVMVAVGIFFAVAALLAGGYAALIGSDRQSRADSDLFTSLSFALESMARSIRTGSEYRCMPGDAEGNSTDGSCHALSYRDEYGAVIAYRVRADGTIGKCAGVPACTDANAASLTDPGIRIAADGLIFYVRNAGQPSVTMTLTGSTRSASAPRAFTVQTTATQRTQ